MCKHEQGHLRSRPFTSTVSASSILFQRLDTATTIAVADKPAAKLRGQPQAASPVSEFILAQAIQVEPTRTTKLHTFDAFDVPWGHNVPAFLLVVMAISALQP